MNRYMIFIPATGKCSLIQCDDECPATLETLQELVDGPIEVTPSCLGASWARELVDGIDLIVNEEGRLRGLPYNGRASDLWEGGGICLLNGDALLVAAKGEDLIGFSKPVCKTICDEWHSVITRITPCSSVQTRMISGRLTSGPFAWMHLMPLCAFASAVAI